MPIWRMYCYAIGLGIAAEEYGSTFFKNGARPSGVLTHPNTVKDPKRLRDSWNAAYGDSANGGKVAVLEESMTFTPISLPNNEAQFLETRKFQVVMSIVFRTFDYKNPERSCPIVFQDSRSRSIGCSTAATAAGSLTLRSGRRTVH